MTLAKKILVIASLVLCLTTFAGKIAIVKDPPDGPGTWWSLFHSLADTLIQEGHIVDYDRHFGWREPSGYEIYFLMIDPYYFAVDAKIESLIAYVETGGKLILQEYSYFRPLISDYLSSDYGWPCFTGNPHWNIRDTLTDSLPSFWADSIDPSGPIAWTVSFATVFSSTWKPAQGIDTLTSAWFMTYSIEDSGTLQPVAFGGADVSTFLYDSFPPVIISGHCGRGEITVLGGQTLFCDAPTSPTYFNMLRFHDNCQFARQLFQCNERADSAWLVLENDSTAKAYLEHDSLLFLADSSFWEVRFTVDTIRNYSFYGYEYGAEGLGDSLEVTFRPGYFYDTVEVCLVRLPDSTGETILPCGRICDTFPERTGIAETHTPEHFAISAYPNPFNSAVKITAPAGAEVEVFDVNGRRIAVAEPVEAGADRLTKDTSTGSVSVFAPLNKGGQGGSYIWRPDPSLGSGVYLVRARFDKLSDRGDGNIATKRVVYLK